AAQALQVQCLTGTGGLKAEWKTSAFKGPGRELGTSVNHQPARQERSLPPPESNKPRPGAQVKRLCHERIPPSSPLEGGRDAPRPGPLGLLKGPASPPLGLHSPTRACTGCHTDTHTLGRDAEFLFSSSAKEEGGGKRLPIPPPPPPAGRTPSSSPAPDTSLE
ncbi:hypothetical protein EI555_011309, partial [Monodon monoceros]